MALLALIDKGCVMNTFVSCWLCMRILHRYLHPSHLNRYYVLFEFLFGAGG